MKDGDRYNPFQLFDGLFVPEWLARSKEVSAGAKLAFGRLVRYAGRNGLAYPAVETLAEEIGYGVRQTQYFLIELQKASLIRKVARVSEIGQTSNLYEFVWVERTISGDSPGAISCIPPLQPSAPPPVQGSAPKESHIEESHLREEQQQQQERAPLLTEAEWPLTTYVIQSRFQSVDSIFVGKLIQDSIQAAISSNLNPEDLTDRKLCQIVNDSINEDFSRPGRTAGLLLKTVPQIIRNRAKTFEARRTILGIK